jgi:putative DNA primase/helicase
MTSPLYAAALEYQERGLPIFPLQPRGKQPACARGCLDATTDIDQIVGWWRQIPDLNIGLATGRPSGLLVIDVDAEDGRRTIADLEDQHSKLPHTVSVITGRDGRGEHLYYKLGSHNVRNSAGLIGRGVDVRGPPATSSCRRPSIRAAASITGLSTAPTNSPRHRIGCTKSSTTA